VSLKQEAASPEYSVGPSFVRDFLSTSAAQAASVALNAASLAVVSRRLGEADLGLYTLERRGMSFFQPLVLLGLSVATPRYIALYAQKGGDRALDYAWTGLLLISGVAGAVGALMLLVPAPIAAIVFGEAEAVDLARALGGFVFATALYQAIYSVCRGYLHMSRANVLELCVVGAIPLLLAALGPTDIVTFMWWMNAAILCATAIVALAELVPRLSPRARRPGPSADLVRELLRFGLARTPGDVAVVVVFAVAPVAVVHWAGVVEAGHTSVVVSSLSLVSVAAVPLGIILLPRVALHAGSPEGIPFSKYVLLGEATLDVAIALCGTLFVASPLIAAFWLPNTPGSVVTALEAAAVGLPGYVYYLVFRSYLDAVEVRPLSSVATLGGLGLLIIALPVLLSIGGWPAPVAATVALAGALSTTGFITYVLVRRRIPGFGRMHGAAPVAAWLAVAIALGLLLRDSRLELVGLGTCGAVVALVAALLLARRRWLVALGDRLKRGSAAG
jgi:O-antigen/teichoic acid export membrane protein